MECRDGSGRSYGFQLFRFNPIGGGEVRPWPYVRDADVSNYSDLTQSVGS